jgi:holo-[acyl-carrier protein] synthase
MIIGLGTDIVENARIKKIYTRFGDKFLKRVYTDGEIAYCLKFNDPVPRLAARFAVKESAVKALNLSGFTGMSLKNVEVKGDDFGKKTLVFHGEMEKKALEIGVKKMHLSMSHAGQASTAVVILEG